MTPDIAAAYAGALALTGDHDTAMALLLDHLGRSDDAARIEAAVDADVTERGASKRSTTEVGDAIASRV